MARRQAGQSVLVFRLGALGDTLVAMPALWAIRRHFPGAHVSLLCNVQTGKRYVVAADLLKDSGVVDEFLLYPVPTDRVGRLLRPLKMLMLAARLRGRGYDTVVYLPPSGRTAKQVARDRVFFRLAGVRNLIGMDVPMSLPSRGATRPLPVLPREMDLLLTRLNAAGIPTPEASLETVSLGLGEAEQKAVGAWLASGLPGDGRRAWVGVGPGSKMPAKRWPVERYQRVVGRLIERFDVWPVIFGGGEDRAAGEDLIKAWGRGYNAAGALGVRASAAAIGRCKLYVGNDTGTMHMAAAGGVPCVAVFSARDFPGMWHPYGEGHTVFRTPIDCEGCMLETCVERGMECVLSIAEGRVLAACEAVLERTAAAPSGARG